MLTESPSKSRHRAAAILVPLGILMMAVGTCLSPALWFLSVLFATPTSTPATQPASAGDTVLILLSIFLFVGLEAIGLTYFLSARRILKGSHTAALTATLVAAIQLALMLILIGASLIDLVSRVHNNTPSLLGRDSLNIIGYLLGLTTNFAMIVALGALLFHLWRTLREHIPPAIPAAATPPKLPADKLK